MTKANLIRFHAHLFREYLHAWRSRYHQYVFGRIILSVYGQGGVQKTPGPHPNIFQLDSIFYQ